MKTITVTSVTYNSEAGTIQINGTVAEVAFARDHSQQVTVGNQPSGNTKWFRAARITEQAFFILRNGVNSVALKLPEWIAQVAPALEPGLTWAVAIITPPAAAACVHSSTAAAFSVTALESELATGYQWQESANGSTGWADVTNAGVYSGATTDTLTITPTDTALNNYYYRCVIGDGVTTATSAAAKLTVT